MATMDCLWRPFLLRHFSDIDRDTWKLWGPSLKCQFRALALSSCSVCNMVLLPAKSKTRTTRYPNPHACGLCGSLCCSGCYCQCRCLKSDCQLALNSQVLAFQCWSCRGSAHVHCHQISFCAECERGFCSECTSMIRCLYCDEDCCIQCRSLVDDVCNSCVESGSIDWRLASSTLIG